MGYACPVCSDPQADAGHLANHLAFTAMLGDDDHEAWLDDHAPGWDGTGERELAGIVGDIVEETEFPQLFEDTVGGLDEEAEPLEERSGALFGDEHAGHSHDHRHGNGTPPSGEKHTSAPMDDETAEVLEKARELTRRMHEGTDDAGDVEDAREDTNETDDDE